MIEITPVQPERRTRRWLPVVAATAAVAIVAGSVGYVAGRANPPKKAAKAPAAAAGPTAAPPAPTTIDERTVSTSTGGGIGMPGITASGMPAPSMSDTKSASGSMAAAGTGQYSAGAYPEDAGTLVTERTAGDLVLRAHLRTYGDMSPNYPGFPDWKPADWCLPDGDLRIGVAGPDIVQVSSVPHYAAPKDGLAVGTFSAGYVEGHPMFGAAVQVGADVTAVTLTTAAGASDTVAPDNGVALLIVPGPIAESFTVGVTHADGSATSLDAQQLTGTWDGSDYHDNCEPPPPALPDAGQQPADPAAAEQALRDAWTRVHDFAAAAESRAQYLDDATGVAEAWQALQHSEFADVAAESTAPIDALVFTSPTEAWLRYDLVTPVSTFSDRYGQALLVDGTWKFTRQTICQDLGLTDSIACVPAVLTLLPPSVANDPRYNPPETVPMPYDAPAPAPTPIDARIEPPVAIQTIVTTIPKDPTQPDVTIDPPVAANAG